MTASRLIGILAVIIAVITLTGRFSFSAAALLAGGVALVLAPRRHAERVLDAFTASLQRWPAIITVAFLDALYWLVIFLSGKTLGKALLAIAQGIRGVDTTAQGLAAIAAVEANTSAIRGVFGGILGSLLAWLAVSFLAYAGSRWLMWQSIRSVRSPFPRWLAGNALWWLIWLLPVVLFVIGLQPAYIGIGAGVVFGLYIHLGGPFHRALVTMPARKAIGHAFTMGLGRIHRFIVPWAFALLVYTILYQPLRFIPAGRAQAAGFIVLVVLFLGWHRVFSDNVIREVVLPEKA
jgi:hypothetical protein